MKMFGAKNTAPARLQKKKRVQGKGITKSAYKKALSESKKLKKAGKSSVVDIEGTDFVVFCNGIIYERTGKKAGKGSLPYKQLAKERQFVKFKAVMNKVRKGKGCVNKKRQAGGDGAHKRMPRNARSHLDTRYVKVLLANTIEKHMKKKGKLDHSKGSADVAAVLKSMERAMKLDFTKHNKDLLYRRSSADRKAIRTSKNAILKKDIWGYNDGKNSPRPRKTMPKLPSETVVRNHIRKAVGNVKRV